ncbi:MAG: hypothetical protein HOE90_22355 [Bacteriovoracaceae bacterium]|jgi:hypothetical protein|nr:hypothetical protein [Bacteriovoracaceae bacterium]
MKYLNSTCLIIAILAIWPQVSSSLTLEGKSLTILDPPKSFSRILSRKLKNPKFTLQVSETHFPAGTAARAEVDKTVKLYNSLPFSPIHITVEEAPHRSKKEVYDRSPGDRDYVILDYIDNNDPGVFPCHRDGGTSCSDNKEKKINGWSANSCKYKDHGGYGMCKPWEVTCFKSKARFFSVALNTHCRKHDTNLNSKDFPKVALLLHEIGHGFGMNHTPSWKKEDKSLISIMQGKIASLSATDAAFLYKMYGVKKKKFWDFEASPAVRYFGIKKKNGVETKKLVTKPLKDISPKELYFDRASAQFLQCHKNVAPKFYANWFNKSFKDAPGLKVVMKIKTETGILVIDKFRRNYPPFSTANWSSKVVIAEKDINLNGARKITGNFQILVDSDGKFTEVNESNNRISAKITFLSRKAQCSRKKAKKSSYNKKRTLRKKVR